MQIVSDQIITQQNKDCALYLQAPDALEQGAKMLPENALFIGGMTALNMALPRMMECYKGQMDVYPFEGYATRNSCAVLSAIAREHQSSCIVGIGGGSAIDTAKFVSEEVGLPVYTVPTQAAQAACTAKLVVIYTDMGERDGSIRLSRPITACFADETLLEMQDNRFLCAGIADALAKPIETYSAELVQQPKGVIWQQALKMGEEMAQRLFTLSQAALAREENAFRQVLYDVLYTPSAIVSLGLDRVQFDISHAFYDAMCDQYTMIRNQFLHGEHVAVGNLINLCLLFPPFMTFDRVFAFQKDVLKQPCSLRELGVDDVTLLSADMEKRRKLKGPLASKLRASLLRIY